MKQQQLILLFTLSIIGGAQAQTIQEISTGAGYQKQSYINLSAGTQKQVANTAWDIAFTVYGQQDAGIFINESGGSSMGQPLPTIELYNALTDDFAEQPDPTFVVDFPLYNSEKNWSYGAFNEVRDPNNPLDFGWGQYNFATNQVVGNAVYVVKLRNGQYRKIKIVSLIGTTYTFKYANLDGSNEANFTLNKADFAGKMMAYFSFDTGNVVNVEPTSGGFDLVYQRYITSLYDPGTMDSIHYSVTGILHGRGAQAAEADGVNPATVAFADYQDSLHHDLDVIGHDWKAFSGTAWSIDEDRVFFLKTADSRVWKLHFIDFEGSTTGTAILEKTDLGIISAVQNPAMPDVQVLTYPNPTVNQVFVSLDLPAAMAQSGRLHVTDLQGRQVLNQLVNLREGFQVFEITTAAFPAGQYTITLQLPTLQLNLGNLIKQ